jgi:RHS repeat-associated protein
VVGTAEYDAFGNRRASSGAQGAIGWAGELRDATTGLTYLRARDYAPGVGRFLTRDTVQPSGPGTQGYNPYAYAGNNPTTLTDPSGHQATTVGVFRGDVNWDPVKGFAIAVSGTFTAEGTLTLLNMIGFSAGSALAIVAVYLLFFVGLILLINATIQWCRANDTCASVAGSVWARIRYLVDGAWSKVETGVGQAGAAVGSFASRYASTAGCAGANGPHGEFGAPPPPEQCNPPCEEAQAEGGSKTSSTEGTAGVEITLSPNPG